MLIKLAWEGEVIFFTRFARVVSHYAPGGVSLVKQMSRINKCISGEKCRQTVKNVSKNEVCIKINLLLLLSLLSPTEVYIQKLYTKIFTNFMLCFMQFLAINFYPL